MDDCCNLSYVMSMFYVRKGVVLFFFSSKFVAWLALFLLHKKLAITLLFIHCAEENILTLEGK